MSYVAACEPGVYRHYKGALYRVLMVVRWSGNDEREGEWVAVYTSDAEHGLHGRFVKEWAEPVRWPDGKIQSRFTFVSDMD